MLLAIATLCNNAFALVGYMWIGPVCGTFATTTQRHSSSPRAYWADSRSFGIDAETGLLGQCILQFSLTKRLPGPVIEWEVS